jgi:hypothetical protein
VATDVDLAYCAGLVDGEGCIRVNRAKAYRCQDRVTPGYQARVQIRMVDEGAIRFFAETLGGWYFHEKAHTAQGRPLFCYMASGRAAETILRALLPYLRVKREAAENALALRDLQATVRSHQTKLTGTTRQWTHWTGKIITVSNRCLSDEYVAQCEALYQRGRELNQVGMQPQT